MLNDAPFSVCRSSKHNWVDAKGFEYRTAYAETKDGTILEIILNVGKCADGTYIVYDISTIKEVARAVEPSKDGNIDPKTTSKKDKYHKNNNKSRKLNQDRSTELTDCDILLNDTPFLVGHSSV